MTRHTCTVVMHTVHETYCQQLSCAQSYSEDETPAVHILFFPVHVTDHRKVEKSSGWIYVQMPAIRHILYVYQQNLWLH